MPLVERRDLSGLDHTMGTVGVEIFPFSFYGTLKSAVAAANAPFNRLIV